MAEKIAKINGFSKDSNTPIIEFVSDLIRCENCKKWNTNDGMFKDFDGKEWHECKELNAFTSACGNVPITPSWHYCSWADRKDEK